jgi:hypothetical protein
MLLASFVVGILHSFFAFLAFRNDVGFWKQRTNMEGISTRSYVANFACQVRFIASLYVSTRLLDGQAGPFAQFVLLCTRPSSVELTQLAAFCQVIIFLKLYEGGETSVIVLAEIGIGVLIEGWKVESSFK